MYGLSRVESIKEMKNMNTAENGYGLLREQEMTHINRIVELSTQETKIASLMGRGLPREVAAEAAGGNGLMELANSREGLWKPTPETTERQYEVGYAIRCMETFLGNPEVLKALLLVREGYKARHIGEYVETTTQSMKVVGGAVARQKGGKMSPEQREKARVQGLKLDKEILANDKNRLPVDGHAIRKHEPVNPHAALGVGVHLKKRNGGK